MSNNTDDNKININSSFNSQKIGNNSPRDDDVELPKSRLSSASKKNEEQRSTYVNNSFANEFSNETRTKSPIISHQDTNQLSNHKLTNENQSTSDSLNYEEQTTFNNHSHSSFNINENNNNESTTNNQNQAKNSLDANVDTDEELNSHRQLRNPPHFSDNEKSPISTPNIVKTADSSTDHPACQFHAKQKWLDLQFHENKTNDKSDDSETEHIKKPNELENEMEDPPGEIDEKILDRIQGSIIGMAVGDSLGAHVEFRPHQYMEQNPVTDLGSGGTWGLEKGQFTDDTSMGLCLANSLVARQDFIPYDQLVRYKWWSDHGYMSSTGKCFDIGAATSQSIHQFKQHQKKFSKEKGISFKLMDYLSDKELLSEFDVYCSEDGVAGNGALMRLAPVPLFFYRNKYAAIEFSGRSGEITHGDKKAYDACRFYGALIVAALRGFNKDQILAKNFYSKNKHWFGEEPLHEDIKLIAEGSYKKPHGYKGGIRGKGYIVNALEAALWAFWSDKGSFKTGALAAVNLGDDTDTTAAIYGQLAGAYYGFKELPPEWLEHVYALKFMKTLSKWILYEGEQWENNRQNSFTS